MTKFYNEREMIFAKMWALFLAVLFVSLLIFSLITYWNGKPILTEMNPNGTVDFWYIGEGAYKSHQ